MRVLISGAGGLIGSALAADLARDRVEVVRLVRHPARDRGEVSWDPERGTVDRAGLEGLDAFVHLAGESLADGRWTPARKRRIRQSRVDATRALSAALVSLERPPATFVSASAVGIYGDRGDEVLTEDSGIGRGFLAEVAEAWEEAAAEAKTHGIRVVHLRTGLVLSGAGGLLAKLRLPFALGLGGPIAGGRAWWSWIAIEDVVRIVRLALERRDLSGPLNLVAPRPVTNAEFTATLGRVMRRPTWFPVPRLALRLAFGEMADEMILASIRALPARLGAAGFSHRHPELEGALRAALAPQDGVVPQSGSHGSPAGHQP